MRPERREAAERLWRALDRVTADIRALGEAGELGPRMEERTGMARALAQELRNVLAAENPDSSAELAYQAIEKARRLP